MSQARNARSSKSPRSPLPAPDYAPALIPLPAAFLAEEPPSGVKVFLAPTSAEAEAALKAWLPPRAAQPRRMPVPRAAAPVASAAYAPGPRARALLRGIEIAESDLESSGGAFDLPQVQRLLGGVSRQAVEKRVKEGSLLAVPGPSNRRRYPAVQFTSDGVIAGLKDVLGALPTRNSWVVLNFLVRPDDRLSGRAPIDLLRTGDVDLVIQAAGAMG